jgi:Oxidoreductase family, NAD-binding Rossmann fold
MGPSSRTRASIYVATHHPWHREWAVRAAEPGKHVLCEKPMAVTEADASQIVAAARRNGSFLAEAFAYRCHPQTSRLLDLLRDSAVGGVFDRGRPGQFREDLRFARPDHRTVAVAAGRLRTAGRIVLERNGHEPEVIVVPLAAEVYTIEINAVNDAIRTGVLSPPWMTWEASLVNMQILDRWRDAIGLRY